MRVQFTCPHCRAVTFLDIDRAEQTGPCRSCGRPVTVQSSPTSTPSQPHYLDPDRILKTTARGSGAGCCVIAAITIALLTIPILIVAVGPVVSETGVYANRELLRRVLTGQGITLAISCVVGLAAGATLVGISAALLRNSPRLLRHAQCGAFLGAIVPPFFIFLFFSFPLMIQSGVRNVGVHMQLQANWFYSLIGCAVGAIAGLLLAIVLSLITGSRRSLSR